jgi:hypothetical protein
MTEIFTIAIAILSLLLSIYVIRKDRKNKRLDNLILCRQRIMDAFDDDEVITVDQMIEYLEDKPRSPRAEKYRAKTQAVHNRVEREFEFACYLVLKRQVDLLPFLDIFEKFLNWRHLTWQSKDFKRANSPFTWKLTELCAKKHLLRPIPEKFKF